MVFLIFKLYLTFQKFLNSIIDSKILMSYNTHLSEEELEDFFGKGFDDLKKEIKKRETVINGNLET